MSIPGAASPLFIGAAAAEAAAYQIDRSLRFNQGDSPSLSKSFGSAGNRKKWTWSGWFKIGSPSQPGRFFGAGGDATSRTNIFYYPRTNNLGIGFFSHLGGSIVGQAGTTAVLADHSAWYHLVFAFDAANSTTADRLKIYINGVEQSISYSVNVSNIDHHVNNNTAHYVGRGADGYSFDGYLAEVHFVDGQALAATDFGQTNSDNNWDPIAFSGSYGSNGFYLKFADNSSNAALGYDAAGSNDWTVNNLSIGGQAYSSGITTALDSSYPAANAFDGSQSTHTRTSGTEVVLNVDFSPGIAVTSSVEIQGEQGFITPNCSITVNGTTTNSGGDPNTAVAGASGTTTKTFSNVSGTLTNIKVGKISSGRTYLSRVLIDGVALIDGSPADNDSLIDTPTNYTASSGNNGGNYCTLNPLDRQSTNGTLSNGNLDLTQSSAAWAMYRGTMAVSSGKWYYEVTIGASQYSAFGILSADYSMASNSNAWPGDTGTGTTFAFYPYDGTKRNGATGTSYATANTSPAGDVYGVAFDLDNGTITFYKNGSSLGQAFSGISGTWAPVAWLYNQSASDSYNFGQRPFAISSIPTGHKSLCTQNLDESAYASIPNGSTAFDVDAYTGNGSTQERSEFSFEPDLVWIKARSAAYNHYLVDQVRGFNGSNVRVLQPNLTNAEESVAGPGDSFASFDDDGFTVKLGTGGWAGTNQNNVTYVAWAWDAGTSTASNTDGSITSNVRVNQSAGFSICTYTGSTGNQSFGHGLNDAPKFIAIKNRSSSANWFVMVDIGTTYYKYGHFNTTDALNDATAQPVSNTTVTLGNNNAWFGANGDNYVAYCWAAVEGYSAFGSYTGNGSTDGPFVHTGFRPRWVMIKNTGTNAWNIVDTERGTYNVVGPYLNAEVSSAEANYSGWDILSNGFKLRNTGGSLNTSGDTYLYMSFAEHPFKTARAR